MYCIFPLTTPNTVQHHNVKKTTQKSHNNRNVHVTCTHHEWTTAPKVKQSIHQTCSQPTLFLSFLKYYIECIHVVQKLSSWCIRIQVETPFHSSALISCNHLLTFRRPRRFMKLEFYHHQYTQGWFGFHLHIERWVFSIRADRY